MLRVNQLAGFGAGAPASVVFGEDSSDYQQATTYNFASQSAGPAAANRIVVVGVWGRDTGSSSPTCDRRGYRRRRRHQGDRTHRRRRQQRHHFAMGGNRSDRHYTQRSK